MIFKVRIGKACVSAQTLRNRSKLKQHSSCKSAKIQEAVLAETAASSETICEKQKLVPAYGTAFVPAGMQQGLYPDSTASADDLTVSSLCFHVLSIIEHVCCTEKSLPI